MAQQSPSASTTKRLIRELNDYAKSPNEALLHLGPINDTDLLRWEAVLKGIKGTPYEGMYSLHSLPTCNSRACPGKKKPKKQNRKRPR